MLYNLASCKDTFAQRRNRLTAHFSEGIAVVKRRISVYANSSSCEFLISAITAVFPIPALGEDYTL